jgi:hypothetical protein
MKGVAFGCFSALLGLIVGAVLTFGFFQFMATGPQPTAVPELPASQSDVSITASSTFINAQIQQAFRQSGFGKQATVTLASPNLIQVSAVVDASALGLPLTVNATVSMRVSVQRGRIMLTIDKVDAGGIALSQSAIGPTVEKMRAAAENQINQLVQRALQGSGLRVSNVRVTQNDLTVNLVGQ